MYKYVLATACLLLVVANRSLAVCEGVVVETTLDTIKIEQGGVRTFTFLWSSDLQAHLIPDISLRSFDARHNQLKKGEKVSLDYYMQDGNCICTGVRLRSPDGVGIVTEVGADTITIRDDKGEVAFYKVKKDLVENSREHYSPSYPSRFGEVKPGCRVEIIYYKEGGRSVIAELDVKKEKKD